MRQFLTTLVVVWMAAAVAAYFYSQKQEIPAGITLALLPAFLVELVFYLGAGFAAVRKAFDQLGSNSFRALLLTCSGVLPYLIESLRTGSFRFMYFLALLSLVAVASFWYAALRSSILTDFLFLAFMAAVYLSKVFDFVYGRPAPHIALAILGKLMWIRLGVLAVLSLRRIPDARFGFLPSSKEWRIGVLVYLCFLPVGAALAWFVHFARFQPLSLVWWKFPLYALGIFAAFLWVVALAEEFYFRVFLQQLIARETHSHWIGLILASALFGVAHLWFGRFPNWRFSIVGAVAGLFYGIAMLKSGSVRTSMVTHALVVTTWRMLFAA